MASEFDLRKLRDLLHEWESYTQRSSALLADPEGRRLVVELQTQLDEAIDRDDVAVASRVKCQLQKIRAHEAAVAAVMEQSKIDVLFARQMLADFTNTEG